MSTVPDGCSPAVRYSSMCAAALTSTASLGRCHRRGRLRKGGFWCATAALSAQVRTRTILHHCRRRKSNRPPPTRVHGLRSATSVGKSPVKMRPGQLLSSPCTRTENRGNRLSGFDTHGTWKWGSRSPHPVRLRLVPRSCEPHAGREDVIDL